MSPCHYHLVRRQRKHAILGREIIDIVQDGIDFLIVVQPEDSFLEGAVTVSP